MSDMPRRQLSGEEILALKFAAHRQLARWAKKSALRPHQYTQRDALKRAVRVLPDQALAHGCDLHAPKGEGEP